MTRITDIQTAGKGLAGNNRGSRLLFGYISIFAMDSGTLEPEF